MILVADSGSSKTDWKGFREGEILDFHTLGINPYFLNASEIVRIVNKEKKLIKIAKEVKEVYFFGAGSSTPDKHEIVSNGLSQIFQNAFISVDNDSIGSAYATCGDQPGYTCILGTGSNVSFYDGQNVHKGKFGIGYILGDEGSGTWFGKRLITSYLYNTMPEELRVEFAKMHTESKEDIISNVYRKPYPNIYLASFSKFISQHQTHPYLHELLYKGFQEFIEVNLKHLPNYDKYQFNFVGSIAFYFQDVLRIVCKKNNIEIGKIVQKPIDDLFQYILKKENIYSELI